MTTHEVTSNEIEEWLHANKKRPAWMAQTLGVTKPTIGRWLRGQEIPEPMQHLLKLLIRGEFPPGFAKPHDPAILAFTPDEWRVIAVEMKTRGASITDEDLERLVEWLGRVKGTNANQ